MSESPAEKSAPPEIKAGDLLAGKYRVERVLGSGGMGVVVAARHEDLDQLVAVKLLRPDLARTDMAITRFQREARAAARIESDHVARVYDVGTLDDGRVYMVMEHLSGSDLGAIVDRQGALPVAEAVGYALQALEAVAHAHAQGIIHRDLKPSNLFLAERPDGSKRLKVLDFGISKSSSPLDRPASGPALTTADAILGSPGYMSPEQVKSSKDVDGRSDIWSMGVILYELLTGAQPFAGETVGEVLAKIIEDTPEPPRARRPEIPEELERAVMRCMERRREARFSSAAELAAAIAPFADQTARSMNERISLVLGRASDPNLKDSGADGRAIISEGRTVSHTADTFAAPGPGGGDPKPAASAPKHAETASLAGSTWSEKPSRASGSKRTLTLLSVFAAAAIISLFIAWRLAPRAPEGAAGRPEAPLTAVAAPPRIESAPAAPVPVVIPAGESASAGIAPPPPAAPSAAASSQASTAKPAALDGVAPPAPSGSAVAKATTTASAAKSSKPVANTIPKDLLRDRD